MSTRLISVAIVVLLAAAPSAAVAATQTRIIGGFAAAPGAWPAHVSVRVKQGSATRNCGGTLVSARWVLTAGHCATDGGAGAPASAFAPVRVGSISRNDGGIEAPVDAVVRHPDFSDPAGGVPTFDLALQHLGAAVAPEPTPLIRSDPSEAALWQAGTTAAIVGWGYTRPSGPQSSDQLQQAEVPMVGDAGCAAASDWGSRFDPARMVCAGRLGIDTCSGDSGRPLLVGRHGVFTLVGVTSWGSSPCAKAGVSGVYARLGDPAIDAWGRCATTSASRGPARGRRARRPVSEHRRRRRLPKAGGAILTLKLTKRAKLALRNRSHVTLSVITKLSAGETERSDRHPVSVRG